MLLLLRSLKVSLQRLGHLPVVKCKTKRAWHHLRTAGRRLAGLFCRGAAHCPVAVAAITERSPQNPNCKGGLPSFKALRGGLAWLLAAVRKQRVTARY